MIAPTPQAPWLDRATAALWARMATHDQLHLLTLPAPPATPGQDRAQATPARTAP